MLKVVGVSFKKAGKIYYFNPLDFNLQIDDKVIVNSNSCLEIGTVKTPIKEISEDEFDRELSPIIRIANKNDLKEDEKNKIDAKEAVKICQEKADKLGLNLHAIEAEFTFDRKKLMIYFSSNNRVDFRKLVKELAAIYRNRIELRQIGVRDHAKLVASVGLCGQKCCCARFLDDFKPLSIKMAKEQDITLDPNKISGLCGRLMCCLSYENENYKIAKKAMPKVGQKVQTQDGIGVVVENNYVKEKCKIRVKIEEDDTEVEKSYCPKDIKQINS
ncbi:PSP1 domain-containing protein [Anaerococcus hydrogenalis]|uniref:Stage 0 sporulation protein n=1 Tax=Anaerococcus hydrogenalis TaxID=33029 RepID=A0A2N6UJ44_9FIRM|nr:regulatory iron-sulfur-containing complex subunit RicT [Anaerococcus hydrogenalis]MDK7695857.1 regulatory iron-sulfur-containing complex subunit RicT [Anaerococcus hydrogenalis]MDK7697577.1 regulatory iron-sulfur-containing complex subunit RicT [Anaerococcus hydrogenalis]MDK7708884.1 regulatory iron-sulfur-containing complex subunit RicT [Anaerococcus hydrogenalis]PMC81735.1 stage 0 sporulation protein [Anaerococcus hydrogenalis]